MKEKEKISTKDVDYLSEKAIQERVDNFSKVNRFVKEKFDFTTKIHNEDIKRLDMRF